MDWIVYIFKSERALETDKPQVLQTAVKLTLGSD